MNDQRDRAFLAVEIGDGERYALAVLVLDLDQERLSLMEKLGFTAINVSDVNPATGQATRPAGTGPDAGPDGDIPAVMPA